MPPRISICMLACNEAGQVAHALSSARACRWCGELVLFDSGSTDQTVAIAGRYADRVEHRPWVDFTTNRRMIVDAAKYDWVFVLDADEEISPELAEEIERLPDDVFRRQAVVEMPRRNHLMGRHVRAWDPDRVARLFDRRRVRWPGRAVHDRPQPVDGGVYTLSAPILHNPHADDFSDYFDGERYAHRTEALAREMHEHGRRVGPLGLWLRPWAAFLKFYILKGGFLDGAFGLLIAQKAAFSTQLKYARLWHLQQEHKATSHQPRAESPEMRSAETGPRHRFPS